MVETAYALSVWDSMQGSMGGYDLVAIYQSEVDAKNEAAKRDDQQRAWLKAHAPNASEYAFTPCDVCPVKFIKAAS